MTPLFAAAAVAAAAGAAAIVACLSRRDDKPDPLTLGADRPARVDIIGVYCAVEHGGCGMVYSDWIDAVQCYTPTGRHIWVAEWKVGSSCR